jgi:hypothetical protein
MAFPGAIHAPTESPLASEANTRAGVAPIVTVEEPSGASELFIVRMAQ